MAFTITPSASFHAEADVGTALSMLAGRVNGSELAAIMEGVKEGYLRLRAEDGVVLISNDNPDQHAKRIKELGGR